jgi:hypothetical protein
MAGKEINRLNEILPERAEDYTNAHIEEIIAWHRKSLAEYSNPSKKKSEMSEVDIEAFLQKLAPQSQKLSFKRRI